MLMNLLWYLCFVFVSSIYFLFVRCKQANGGEENEEGSKNVDEENNGNDNNDQENDEENDEENNDENDDENDGEPEAKKPATENNNVKNTSNDVKVEDNGETETDAAAENENQEHLQLTVAESDKLDTSNVDNDDSLNLTIGDDEAKIFLDEVCNLYALF